MLQLAAALAIPVGLPATAIVLQIAVAVWAWRATAETDKRLAHSESMPFAGDSEQ